MNQNIGGKVQSLNKFALAFSSTGRKPGWTYELWPQIFFKGAIQQKDKCHVLPNFSLDFLIKLSRKSRCSLKRVPLLEKRWRVCYRFIIIFTYWSPWGNCLKSSSNAQTRTTSLYLCSSKDCPNKMFCFTFPPKIQDSWDEYAVRP